MNPYIVATMSRKRSGLTTFDHGLARCLTTFVLGSVAQGAPFVLIAAALERRGSGAGWLAAVAAVRLAPYLVCSPVAGALAGRYGARTVFVSSGLGRGVLILALWLAAGVGAPPLVLVALLFSLVAVGTPTFPTLMREVRDTAAPARLDRSSALAAGLESAAFGAGPALGGLLLLTGTTNAVLVCAAMMAVSAGLATSLPITGGTARSIAQRPKRPVRDAGRCLLGLDVRRAIVAVVGVNVLAGLNAALLVRLPAELDLGDARTFGLLSFVCGVGAFAAFVVLLGPIRRGRRPLLPLAVAGAAVALLSATSDLSVAMVACSTIGAAILTAEVHVTGTLGHSLPGALVAPAFGVLDAVLVAAMVGGALVAPVLTAAVGLRPTLAVAGIGTPVLAICALQVHRRGGGR